LILLYLYMYKCKYCGREFESKTQLGGHTGFCKLNPNREQNLKILNFNRAHIDYKNIHNIICNCKYCGKTCGNKGALIRHENNCCDNPFITPSKSALYKKDKQYRKEHNINIRKGRKLSNEHKQKIREGYYKWMSEHREEFLNYSKGQSKACEHFKQILKNNGIDFIEEYTPYWKERGFRLDIAFPDEKIGIEINGTQHYNRDGELNETSKEKQQFFENRGWKIIQIYYNDAYKENPKCLNDILSLPIRNKQYIREDIDERLKNKIEKQRSKQEKFEHWKAHQEYLISRKIEILNNLIKNSGIDFSKQGWSTKAKEYLQSRGELYRKDIYRDLKKYFPDFLNDENTFRRRTSGQGTCWINKNGINKKIKRELLEGFLEEGWLKGRII